MAYQSPLHIIKSISNEENFEINNVNLIRLRKRLLAELNLSGEATIAVNNRAYSKDEIIKTIDQLLDNPDLELHEVIYQNTFLLEFLENDNAALNPFMYNRLNMTDSTRNKLNHLLHERFIIQFKKGLSTRKFTQSEQALVFFKSLPDDLREICYEEVHRSLHTFSTFLHELEHTMTLDRKDDIFFLCYDSFSQFFNSLPEEFEAVKYDMINRIINLLVAYHKLKKHDKDLAKGISMTLVRIKCDEDQEMLIKKNHRVFISNDSTSDYSYFRYIVIAIVILVNVLRACSRDNSPVFNHNSNYQGVTFIDEVGKMKDKPTLENELKMFRTEIYNKGMIVKNGDIGISQDTLKIITGNNPFSNGFKFSNDSVFQNMSEVVKIKNDSRYDLIVMAYDSAQTSFYAKYINQNETAAVSFNDQTRFIFYFGKHLIRPSLPVMSSLQVFFPHEYFLESPALSIDLLGTNYKMTIFKNKQKKKTVKPPVLALDSTFYGEIHEELKTKEVNMVRMYE